MRYASRLHPTRVSNQSALEEASWLNGMIVFNRCCFQRQKIKSDRDLSTLARGVLSAAILRPRANTTGLKASQGGLSFFRGARTVPTTGGRSHTERVRRGRNGKTYLGRSSAKSYARIAERTSGDRLNTAAFATHAGSNTGNASEVKRRPLAAGGLQNGCWLPKSRRARLSKGLAGMRLLAGSESAKQLYGPFTFENNFQSQLKREGTPSV
jgi:hypothetical protein